MSDIKNLNDYKLDSNQRKDLIDSLLNIRLSLNVKKIISNTINKSELKRLVEEQTLKLKDEIVKSEIDKVFDEYFMKEEKKNNDELSIEQMGEIIQNKIGENQVLTKEFKPKKSFDETA